MDNRLDCITEFKDVNKAIKEMASYRNRFVELDELLKEMDDETKEKPAVSRCIALARTNLEIGLQYSIKAICLKWEKK